MGVQGLLGTLNAVVAQWFGIMVLEGGGWECSCADPSPEAYFATPDPRMHLKYDFDIGMHWFL